jgi:N-acyl-D-aspartate/D-glutamate deacylase
MELTRPVRRSVWALALGLISIAGRPSGAVGQAAQYDLVIHGGRVVDGTGAPWYWGDLAVSGGRIAAIGRIDPRSGRRAIDASGKVVAPGFVDMMGQTGSPFIRDPGTAFNLLSQGITTINAGEGGSDAPLGDREAAERGWRTMREYFARLEHAGLPMNVAQTVGHTQLREIVIGDVDRQATPAELDRMRGMVKEAMEAGAIGVSTSLIYPPAIYASEEEIAELAKVAGQYGGRYFSHMRNEGDRLLEAIDEALRIGKAAGTPVHLYHLKTAGQGNWGKMDQALARIRAARAAGQQVGVDVYPYINNGLGIRALIHPRHAAQGQDALMKKLEDQAARAEMRREMETLGGWENWFAHAGRDWDRIVVARLAGGYQRYNGQTVAAIARAVSKDPWEVFFELCRTDAAAMPQSMSDANKIKAMREEFTSFDTDAGPAAFGWAIHPRGFGAFPRLFGRYVRELGALTLEAAVQRAAAVAANRGDGLRSRQTRSRPRRRHRGLRSAHHSRPRHLRRALAPLRGNLPGAGERAGGVRGRQIHRGQAGQSPPGTGVPTVTMSSRRQWLDRAARAVALLALPGPLRGELLRPRVSADRRYLDLALRIAAWIETSKQVTDQGTRYPADPLKPESVGLDFYNGMPGVVLFDAALAHATRHPTWLAAARSGADYLIAEMESPGDALNAGLYTGLAGLGYTFDSVARAGGGDRYSAAARRAAELIASRAKRTAQGVEWSDSWDIISGIAGTGLFLLGAAKTGDRGYLGLAGEAGRRLLTVGEPADGGLMWFPAGSFRRNYPNFSHGTAGVGYFLATLYQRTNDRQFLDGALAAVRYLDAVATRKNGATTVFHQSGGGEGRFYLSWCHGPVGTARLFYRLHQITGESKWLDWVRSLTRGVLESGVPERRTEGYWNNISQCCGNVGIGQYCVDLARYLPTSEAAGLLNRVLADTLKRATDDESGLRWVQAENRTQPENLVAQTGFMQGAAGVGAFLLQLDAFERGERWPFPQPDTPFQ